MLTPSSYLRQYLSKRDTQNTEKENIVLTKLNVIVQSLSNNVLRAGAIFV